jgi:hypothetical protein
MACLALREWEVEGMARASVAVVRMRSDEMYMVAWSKLEFGKNGCLLWECGGDGGEVDGNEGREGKTLMSELVYSRNVDSRIQVKLRKLQCP